MGEILGLVVLRAGPSQRAHHAGGDGPVPRRRMSAKRKQGTVLRLLKGEPIEWVSRELGVTAAELSTGAMPFSLAARPPSERGQRTTATSRSRGLRARSVS
jgi:hypothetical protein